MSNTVYQDGTDWFDIGSRVRFAVAVSVAVLASIAAIRDIRLVFILSGAAAVIAVVRAPRILLFLLFSFALLRLDAWISTVSSLPFGKVVFLFTSLSVVSIVLVGTWRLNRLSGGVLTYFVFLCVYFVLGLIESQGSGPSLWLSDVVYALTFLVAVYLVVNDRDVLGDVMKFVVLIGAVASLINIFEFFHPYTITLSHSTGRAAGLLKNANTSAFIVNVSFITSFYLLRSAATTRRAIFTVLLQGLMFLGVFVTFSREGMLVFAAVLVVQVLSLGRRKAAASFLLIFLLAVSGVLTVRFITNSSVVDVQRSFTKISSLVSGNIDDNDRLYLLGFHLKRFLMHPFTGNGLYSALEYSVPRLGLPGNGVPNGPHNTFALILSEGGVFAASAYLVFLFGVFAGLLRKLCNSSGESRMLVQTMMILFFALMIHHFFSHMLIFSRYAMVLFGLFLLPDRIYSSETS